MTVPVQGVVAPYAALSLPPLLADESLYSWASRYHRRTCNALARHTSLQLFGRPLAGTAHDLPCGLDALTLRTQGHLGSAESLARQRTLLPFYLPTRSVAAQNAAIAVLRGEQLRSLKYQLGMLTSGFGAYHPLKACARCLHTQREEGAEAYWLRAHQWPGVWVCPVHGTWLAAAQVKRHGISRFQWVLPDAAQLQSVGTGTPPPGIVALGSMVAGWCALPHGFAFDPARLLTTYRRALKERGWMRGDATLAHPPLQADYAVWCDGLHSIPELAPLFRTGSEVALARVLRQARGGVHPLRHLAVIAWLFPNWESFCTAYCSGEADAPPARAAAVAVPISLLDDKRATFIALLAKTTLRQAAVAVGIAMATAQRWATQEGVVVARRPQVLLPKLRASIIARLHRGQRQVEIAAACEVHVALVRAVLRTEVGLAEQWRAALAETRRAQARAAWTKLRGAHPGAPRKVLRARAPAAFVYLYRHDRAWLAANVPPIATRRSPNNPRLDWEARDNALCHAVSSAAAALQRNGLQPPFPLWRLCQRIPELRSKVPYLKRLPRTSALLNRLRTRPRKLRADAPVSGQRRLARVTR